MVANCHTKERTMARAHSGQERSRIALDESIVRHLDYLVRSAPIQEPGDRSVSKLMEPEAWCGEDYGRTELVWGSSDGAGCWCRAA